MHKTIKLALTAATPVLLLAGCSDFLKGAKLTNNPNQPTQATTNQLFVGVEVAVMAQYENYPLMLFMTWAQNIAGVNRQWQTYASYNGGTDQGAAEGAWDQTYGPGGLRDIRTIEASTTADGFLRWRGETRVLEALYMGTAADIWGDVPYSDALAATPTFDSQATVYAHVLALLDSAITDMGDANTTVPSAEFFYNNDMPSWIAMAHTLKARYIMHTAQTAAGVYDATHLNDVLTETGLGISSAAGDFKPSHTSSPGEQNLFYSFQFSRAGDVMPAGTHISLTKQAGETAQLPQWYTPSSTSTGIYGAEAGLPVEYPDGYAADSISIFEVTNDPAAAWPIVSYAENQMLMAEAQARTTGFAAGVVTLNNYRATLVPAPGPLAPANLGATLADILREKFIHSFFNIEVWNDYLRTCYPNIPQPAGVNPTNNYVPGRLPVSANEQATNPNVPPQNNGSNPLNANNFKLATDPQGNACIGQANLP